MNLWASNHGEGGALLKKRLLEDNADSCAGMTNTTVILSLGSIPFLHPGPRPNPGEGGLCYLALGLVKSSEGKDQGAAPYPESSHPALSVQAVRLVHPGSSGLLAAAWELGGCRRQAVNRKWLSKGRWSMPGAGTGQEIAEQLNGLKRMPCPPPRSSGKGAVHPLLTGRCFKAPCLAVA